MYYDIYENSNYRIVLAGDENGISNLFFDNGTKEFEISENWEKSDEYFKEAKQQIDEYFSGKRKDFQLKLNPKGTGFQRKVWEELSKIPYGELRTYKDIAVAVGNPKASRAIGMANNKNPIPLIIPCHRVVGSNRKLVGYAYGLEMKNNLLNLETISSMFDKLQEYYGELNWWPAQTDFEMMVGAILTQNTTWINVEKALANFENRLTPEFIRDIPLEELSELIRPSGYYNQKAIKLKELAKWFEKYGFNIEKAKEIDKEELRNELLDVNGIGRETADSILVYALEKPSFVIDTYTKRILYRLGIDLPLTYDELRLLIEKCIPEDVTLYAKYHGLIVEHAKQFCLKTPQCDSCPLLKECNQRMY
jgi:endonuclease-3 related protein